MNLHKVSLDRPREKKEAEEFLQANDLRLDPLDTAYCLRDNAGRMIGFGGREKDVLKCFAFDAAHRGRALMNTLITELITDAFHAGIEDLLIYTKYDYLEVFLHFGFHEVAHTDTVALLQRGDNTPKQAMDALSLQVNEKAKNGAIVINANPFTLGHLALTEHAASRVDHLIVFVVEHDASFFPFADRFRLVKEGVAHLDNVTVVPSTRYIVSASTFPSYFLKEEEVGEMEHAKLDAEIFVKWFVPRFSIRTRFLGEEPTDRTTANYNAALSSILPPACEVVIIPRKKLQDQVISASTVRRFLKEGNWEEIRERVPETTYRYLRENHV